MATVLTRKFKCRIEPAEGPAVTFIKIPFDVKEVFGKGRLPVQLTVNGYTYRTTIVHMGGVYGVPLRREHRENAKVEAGDMVQVSVVPDTEPRIVGVPGDLRKFLRSNNVWELFEKRSYTHKKEFIQWITGAKREETRATRKQKFIQMLQQGKHL